MRLGADVQVQKGFQFRIGATAPTGSLHIHVRYTCFNITEIAPERTHYPLTP